MATTRSKSVGVVGGTVTASTGSDRSLPPCDIEVADTDGDLPQRDPGRYLDEGEHGRGGLGRVIVARDRELGRKVAIKELLTRGRRSDARFVREARITARLEHPAIVPVHEAGRWPDGTPFYSMKLVSGQPLSSVIEQTRDFEARLALLPKVTSIADAVAYAHSQRIIHRDLKPSNIIVGDYGETVVIDWGLAKALDEVVGELDGIGGPYRVPEGEQLTRAGGVLGTPAYMPPEQARGEAVDERADVYSIGAILYHLLTGRCPYSGSDSNSIVQAVLGSAPVALADVQPNAPGDLVAIVDKAMAREPEDRYPSARELAEDLQKFQTGQLVGAHHYTRGQLLRRWISRHRAPIAVAVVAVVVLATVAGFSVKRVMSERDLARARASELILLQAKSWLERDPTSAMAWLEQYPDDGAHWERVRDIAADAESRGVARYVLQVPSGRVGGLSFIDSDRLVSVGKSGSAYVWELSTLSGRVVGTDAEAYPVATGAGRIAYAARNGEVVLLDASGEILGRERGGAKPIQEIATDRRGRRMVTRSEDSIVRLWDLAEARVLSSHNDASQVALAASGEKYAYASSTDQSVRLREISSGKEQITDIAGARYLALDSDARRVAAHLTSGAVVLHDVSSHDVWTLARVEEWAALKFSGDDRYLACTGYDGTARVWDVATRTLLFTERFSVPAQAAAFSPDSALFVAASANGEVRIRELTTGATWSLRGHTNVRALAVSEDGRWLASGDENGQIRVWPMPAGRPDVLRGHKGYAYHARYSPDGQWIASDGWDRTIRLWSTRGDEHHVFQGHQGIPFGVEFSPDGKLVASAGEDGVIQLWRVGERAGLERSLRGHSAWIDQVMFSPEGETLASASRDGTVRVWNLASGKDTVLEAHDGGAYALSFSPSGRLLATGGADGAVKVFRADDWSGRKFDLGGEVLYVNFVRDDTLLVAATDDGRVSLMDLSRETVRELWGHSGVPVHLAVSLDGRWIVSSAEEDAVHVYDRSSRKTRLLRGHDSWVREFSISDDSRTLATASQDGTVRLWRLDSGEVSVLRGHEGQPVRGVDFSPDGAFVASASWDGTIRVWPSTVDRGAPLHPSDLRRWIDQRTSYTVNTPTP